MIVITGLDRSGLDRTAADAGSAEIFIVQMLLGEPPQIPLDLRADDACEAMIGKPAERFAQKLARREMKRPAVVEIFIAQDPADAPPPGKYAECRGVGDDRQVGRTGHLVEAHTAAARERREDAGAGGIERRRGDADIVAV